MAKILHGFENHAGTTKPMRLMRWVDTSGTYHEELVLEEALRVIADSERAPLTSLLAARLEMLQVYFGGPLAVAEKVGVSVEALRKIRHGNYFKLTGRIMTKIDDLWDRTFAYLKYGQKN